MTDRRATLPGSPPREDRGRQLSADMAKLARDRFLWTPIAFGYGIAGYFGLRHEPSLVAVVACLALGLVTFWSLRRRGTGPAFVGMMILAMTAGFAWVSLRADLVAGPMLDWRVGPVIVEGTLIGVDRRGAATTRLLIDVATIDGVAADETPERVRLSRRGLDTAPRIGSRISLRAVMLPPPDAALPGGFDFRRSAYFDRIGAVGFAISDPDVLAEPASGPLTGLRDWLGETRNALSQRLREAAPGTRGEIASALIVGKRGGIDDGVSQDLRDTGLAHILAISGLHMALFAGTVFAVCRFGLAGLPGIGMRYPVKKLAALAALVGAVVYLGLSGAGIATQRAFIMAAIMLVAVLLDRPAITLRNVALAALVVLIIAPDAVLSVSFQMSFAAAAALVAVYQSVRRRRSAGGWTGDRATLTDRVLHSAGGYVFALALTSVVAGLTTSLFAAYHFGRFPVYQLIANLAAMPVFGTLVMPPAVVTLVALPFGLEAIPLMVMGIGIDGVLAIADHIAAWPGARIGLTQIPFQLMAAISLALWLVILAPGLVRLAGAAALTAGLVWAVAATPVPIAYIDREAGLIAASDEADGLWRFAGVRRSSFVIEAVLRGTGDTRNVEEIAFTRCRDSVCRLDSGPTHIALFDIMPEPGTPCGAAIAVLRGRPDAACPDADHVIDWDGIDRNGAMMVHRRRNGTLYIVATRDRSFGRPWALRSRDR